MSENVMVRLEGVTKIFTDCTAVDNQDLDIYEGEFLTLLGPSGCGKTTTLRMIAGLEIPTNGRILIHGEDVTFNLPSERDTSIMFQNYALFPHKTVGENIAFGLKMRGIDKKEQEIKVREMLDFVQLPAVYDRKPHQLSGGQCQRVALARSLVMQPSVLLLDEPLGALDAGLRKAMQLELKNIQRKTGITFIYVTHDQEEALTMSDRIAVMQNGVIEQLAPPSVIYEQPKNEFVAKFVGRCNLIPGKVIEQENGLVLVSNDALGRLRAKNPAGEIRAGEEVKILVRPEKVWFSNQNNTANGTVISKAYVGSRVDYQIECNGLVLLVEADALVDLYIGDEVDVCWEAKDSIIMPKNFCNTTE